MRAALQLADEGFYVFACIPNGKAPATTNGLDAATRNLRAIERKWYEAPYNIGIACGRSGIVGLDFDNKNGISGGVNLAVWMLRAGIIPTARELPDTRVHWTASGGGHVLYRAPENSTLGNSSGSLPEGVDVRGRRGYLVGPGSAIGGARYFVHPRSKTLEIAPLPDAVIAALTPIRREPSVAPLRGSIGPFPQDRVIDEECGAVAALRIGQRHDGLLRAGHHLGSLMGAGKITQHRTYIESRLLDAVSQQADPYPYREAVRDVRDSLHWGIDHPRPVVGLPSMGVGL